VPSSTAQVRVDAFLDLLGAGRAHLGTPSDSSGVDRYTVHAVIQVDVLAERFGCWRRTCDIHHLLHYDDGGPTAA
jgi:hypothetical protein